MTLDLGTWAQAGAALAAVLLLALLAAHGLRGTAVARHTGRRLRIEEAIALDTRRRLVLIRCDQREALLLLGDGAGTVVGWLPAPPA